MKPILILFFLLIGHVQAQESLDVRFLATQRSSGNPFSIPLSINKEGKTTFLGAKNDHLLAFRPTILASISWANINYSRPVLLNRFNFYPLQDELGLIELKRLRVESGLGLSTLINASTMVGFIPYKGCLNTVIRNKNSSNESSLSISMPKTLSELDRWKDEDIGIYQTYGGVTVYAGFSAGVVDISQVSLGFQNQFIIEMTKVSSDKVVVKISEENLRRRQVILGPFLSQATYGRFKGQRFSYVFELNPRIKSHHNYFKEALKGNIIELQQKLPVSAQKVTWIGSDHRFFVGVPFVIGKTFQKAHYELNNDGSESELNFRGSESKGIISPIRNFQDYVYQTKESLVLIWASEMNRTSTKAVESRFLSKGRIIGARGFNRQIPSAARFGSVVSQLGIHFSKSEIEALKDMDNLEFENNLKNRCEEQMLSCRSDKKVKKILKNLEQILKKPLEDLKREVGLLFMKEPALVHAVIKTLGLKKEIYFKFLSENFQSLEGSSQVEI